MNLERKRIIEPPEREYTYTDAAVSDVKPLDAFRVLAAIGWADGVLRESEANFLVRVILVADLTPEEREAAGRLLDALVALPEAYVVTLAPEARLDLYRKACRMAAVDKSISDAERHMLARVRAVLEIAPEVAEAIEREVSGIRP